jgi:hypothetical protein
MIEWKNSNNFYKQFIIKNLLEIKKQLEVMLKINKKAECEIVLGTYIMDFVNILYDFHFNENNKRYREENMYL